MLVETKLEDRIGTLILDHPAKRNALGKQLVEELLEGLESFQSQRARAIVIRARPEATVWSSGHDIGELPQGEDPLRYSDPLERLLRAVAGFPAPVIAMVHGSVWGGATDLALSCDLIIGDETCSFAITPANLGLAFNTVGLLHFLRRLPLNLIKEMFFTAAPIKADAARDWGLLNHLVPANQLESFTYDLARVIASKAPLVLTTVKEQLRLLAEAAPITPEVFERIQGLRETVYRSADYREGIRAFLEKRKPQFEGK